MCRIRLLAFALMLTGLLAAGPAARAQDPAPSDVPLAEPKAAANASGWVLPTVTRVPDSSGPCLFMTPLLGGAGIAPSAYLRFLILTKDAPRAPQTGKVAALTPSELDHGTVDLPPDAPVTPAPAKV